MNARRAWCLAGALAAVAGAGSTRSGAAQTEPTFTFAAAGDFSLGANFRATAAAVQASKPAFLLALGDLSYEQGSEQSWCNHWLNDLAFRNILLIAGNHDTGESRGGKIHNYITHCKEPFKDQVKGTYGRQYYLDYPVAAPLARFIMVTPGVRGDTGGLDTNYRKGSAGYKFTDEAIKDARSKGIRWIFVGMHKNYVSVMEKGNDVSTDSGRTFMTLLLDHRVDVILQGHEHGYERTKQLATNPKTCPIVPTDTVAPGCVVDPDGTLVKGAGTVIQVIGTAGKDMRSLNRRDSEIDYFVDRFAYGDNEAFGFGSFTVTSRQLSFSFVRSAGADFWDDFTITDGFK